MSEFIEVYLDVTPDTPKTERTKEDFGNILRQKFEQGLPGAVERIWELPPVILQKPLAEYVSLLVEARELFVVGRFYSCVAMCGIVGERLVKDMLRASVLVHKAGNAIGPPSEAFDQLERVEVSGITGFLNKAALLDDGAKKAAQSLGELRNQYAHARGRDPHADAIKAIKLLHTLVEGTVSVFKDFEITDKGLAPKTAAPPE
ncbi:MAG TPA: hypothetical protein VIY49_35910 [Bryobacteraceae bacterium]